MKNLMIITVAILYFLTGCHNKVEPGSVKADRPKISGVTTEKVRSKTIDLFYETSGTVKAINKTIIASKIMATVSTINGEEGDSVEINQLLITLDNKDIIQKVKSAEAGYNEAQRALASAKKNKTFAASTYNRFKNLYDGKALTKQEFDQVETKKILAENEVQRVSEMVKRAEAGRNEAKTYLEYATIRAPFSGIIINKHIDIGSMASPGMPLITIADTSQLEVEARIDEKYAGSLKTGQPIILEITSLNGTLPGKIKKTIPSVDPSSRTFLVKIAIDEKDLQPGLYTKIKIPVVKKKVILVPEISLVFKGQLTGVHVVGAENIITYRLIKTGKRIGSDREILSGLKENETIITKGTEKAIDGGVLSEAVSP